MRKLALGLLVAAVAAVLGVVAATRGGGPGTAAASSHREAPLISQDPTADNTDLYAFVSPDKPSTATIISNWIPGEDPAAGPNYYTFSSTARRRMTRCRSSRATSRSRHPIASRTPGSRI